jgi:hypothetical protein
VCDSKGDIVRAALPKGVVALAEFLNQSNCSGLVAVHATEKGDAKFRVPWVVPEGFAEGLNPGFVHRRPRSAKGF